MSQLNELLVLLSYITVLSVTVERWTEMLKPALDGFVCRTSIGDKGRRTLMYLISFSSGAVLHAMSGSTIPYFTDPVGAALVAGMLVSGGSGIWHDLLSILGDFKAKAPVVK